MLVLRIVVALFGLALVAMVVAQAVRTFVVARAVSVPSSRFVFVMMRRLLDQVVRIRGGNDDRVRRDAILGHWAPLSLVALPGFWLALSLTGYAAVFWAADQRGVRDAVEVSGSSLLTLGFASPGGFGADLIAFSEAAVGIALLALVIAYLPTIYGAYSRRELIVAMLDARAGNPPSATHLMLLHHRFAGLSRLDEKWGEWEQWAVDIGETHVTYPALPFFRSATHDRSWIIAFAALLDAANMRLSAIMLPGGGNQDAWMFLTAATRVVRDIATYFQIPVESDGEAKLGAAEFGAAMDELAAAGLPLDEDREVVWERFAARRARYEPAVLGLAALVDAPPAPWSSDRAPDRGSPAVFPRRRR